MKKNIKGSILITLFFSMPFLANANNQKEHQYLDIKSWTTHTDTVVYFVQEKSLPMVDINVLFHAGSAYDGEKFGLSSMTTSLIGTSTNELSENQLIDAVSDLGTQISSSNNRDSLTISFRSLSAKKYLNPSISLYSDIITQSVFKPNIFERIQGQYLTNIKFENESPKSVAQKAFYTALYGKHPYAHSVNGTEKSINNITIKDVHSFYNKYLVGKNAIITIVGDLSQKQAKQISEQITQGLNKGEKASAIPIPNEPPKTQIIRISFPSQQTTILIGTLGIKKGGSMYFPLAVDNQIFGGSGLTSLLFNKVRKERGLAYGAYSSFSSLEQKGPFIISTQTRNEKASETIEIINQTFSEFIKNGATTEEIISSKKYITGSFPLSFASNQSKLGMLSLITFYGLPLNYLNTYTDNINSVTKDKANQDFSSLIGKQKMITVIVGGKANQKKYKQSDK